MARLHVKNHSTSRKLIIFHDLSNIFVWWKILFCNKVFEECVRYIHAPQWNWDYKGWYKFIPSSPPPPSNLAQKIRGKIFFFRKISKFWIYVQSAEIKSKCVSLRLESFLACWSWIKNLLIFLKFSILHFFCFLSNLENFDFFMFMFFC